MIMLKSNRKSLRLDTGAIENARAQSIIDRLANNVDVSNSTPNAAVIQKAIFFFVQLHKSLKQVKGENGPNEDIKNLLYDPKSRRTIHGLLDLISLEGIYPALSPGVGVPLECRVKSVLPPGVVAKPHQAAGQSKADDDSNLLPDILRSLVPIALEKTPGGLGPIIQERCLIDLFSACGELAFRPGSSTEDQNHYKELFGRLLDQYVIFT
jgi:hypothetical protein